MPQGPFSSYLTETFQPQTPQPTGFETTPVAIAAIGSKFLDGLRQSRLQKAAMAERENEKIQRGYEQALAFLDKQEGVDPAIKQQHLNQISQAYLGHIAGQKESSKDTGHPMTDMVKNIATNLIGGQLPKKGAPLDQGLIGQAFVAMSDPANRTDNLLARLNSDFATALKTGNVADIRTATAHPEYSKIVAEGRRLTGKQDWQPDIFQSLAADPLAHNQQQLQLAVFSDPAIKAMMPGAVGTSKPPLSPATTSSANDAISPSEVGAEGPSPVIANQALQTATPPGIQPAPVTQGASRNLFSDIEESARKSRLLKFAGAPDFSNTPTLGKPEPVIDSQGNRHNARNLPIDWNGHKAGYYSDSSVHLPGAQLANRLDPDKVKPLTPEQISKSSIELKMHVRKALKDPALIQAAESAIDSNLASNNLNGAGNVLTRYMQMQQTQDSTEASRAMAVSNREIALSNKNSLIPAPEIVNNVMSDLADGVTSLDSFGKEYKDSRAQKAVLEPLRSSGFRPLTQKNVDRINAISSVANEFIPAYENMIRLLSKEKNPQLQYINGMISNAFTTPELNAAKQQINSMITNLAKTIGGEVRGVTDADAKRVLGYGPQGGYTVDLNKQLLDKFKKTLTTTLTSDVPGLSPQQLLRIAERRGGTFGDLLKMHVNNKGEKDVKPKVKVNYLKDTPGYHPNSSAPVPTDKPKITVKPI